MFLALRQLCTPFWRHTFLFVFPHLLHNWEVDLTISQPILKQVTTVLTEGSKAVIDTDDQYQVCP